MIRLIRSFAPVLLLAACAAPLARGSDAGLLPREKWERQGMDDYRYVYSLGCFCPDRGPVHVTVRDGQIAEVRRGDSSARVAGDAQLEVLTVDQLFDRIAEAQASGTYTRVEYHPQLGYPTSAEIGTLANDAGVRYLIADLAPLD